jgi:hypothetical protein
MEAAPDTKGSLDAHVKLGDEARVIPAGSTVVSKLKEELGVDAAQSLFMKDRGKRRLLANDEVVDVKDGMHFESLGGGGVS